MTKQFSVGAVEAMAEALDIAFHLVREHYPEIYDWTSWRNNAAHVILEALPYGWELVKYAWTEPEHTHTWTSDMIRIRCTTCDMTPYDVLLERRATQMGTTQAPKQEPRRCANAVCWHDEFDHLEDPMTKIAWCWRCGDCEFQPDE